MNGGLDGGRNMNMQDLATRSYWLGLDGYEPGPPLQGEMDADVAIVGGGFTGLWAAYHLLKADPGLTVIVLEGEAVGYGASGRNGGFGMTLVHRSLQALVGHLGRERALAIHRAAEEAVHTIQKVCDEENIGADLMPNGLLTVSNTPLQDEHVRREAALARDLGIEDMRLLDRDEIQGRVHSETFRCALEERTCVLVNPARLVRGLKDAVIRAGGRVYEQTRMEELSQSQEGVSIRTRGGTVQARRALLATNAYSGSIPELRDRVTPFYSYILLSEPLSDEQWGRVGWDGREGMEDRRTFLHYFRPTIDGRIMWAGRDAPYRPDGPDPKYDRDERVFRRLEKTFAWTFPQLLDVKFEYEWGGPVGVTSTFLPGAGWLDGHKVAYAFGFNGHGVAITCLLGMAVRDLITERDTEFSRLALVGKKPASMGPRLVRDPIIRAVSDYQQRQDDAGREIRPPPLVRVAQRLFGGF
jgi:glycine/D-amino acid oxidase-like deaminating enzyme